MSKRTLTLFFCLLYSTINVNAQYIPAGSHGEQDYYYDFSPDTALNCGNISCNKSVTIDVNNDLINDFLFTVFDDEFGHWHHYESSTIEPLNGNRVAISGFDSCFSMPDSMQFNYLYREPMVNFFNINDTINENNFWIDSAACISFDRWSANYPDAHGYSCRSQSFPSQPVYIGVSVITSNQTLYGWIKLEADGFDSIVIHEFACNLYTIGIENPDIYSWRIYPNPGFGKFIFMTNEPGMSKCDLEIYNVHGIKIYSNSINSIETAIDLSHQPKGLFFVKIVSENKSETQKIIIE